MCSVVLSFRLNLIKSLSGLDLFISISGGTKVPYHHGLVLFSIIGTCDLRAIYTHDTAFSQCSTISNVQGTRVNIYCIAFFSIETYLSLISHHNQFHCKLSA